MHANDMVDLTEDERAMAVLDVLKREGNANPLYIREQTGYSKGDVNTALNQLAREGHVTRLTRGLWSYQNDPRDNA